MSEEKRLNRRQFMSVLTGAIAAIIGVAMGVPALAYIIGPALQKVESNWIRLGSLIKIKLGEPTLFKASVNHQTGWVVSEEEIATYVLTEDGRTYIAMSNICTHLGCRVRWVAKDERFYCPCHAGIFDKQGNVVSGPPPRPLDRFQTKVQDNELYILNG
jgi:menaquinol-cytochrome c reductase iron-sulfur subunit